MPHLWKTLKGSVAKIPAPTERLPRASFGLYDTKGPILLVVFVNHGELDYGRSQAIYCFLTVYSEQ